MKKILIIAFLLAILISIACKQTKHEYVCYIRFYEYAPPDTLYISAGVWGDSLLVTKNNYFIEREYRIELSTPMMTEKQIDEFMSINGIDEFSIECIIKK